MSIGDELPVSRKHRGLDMARRGEASARLYVTTTIAGMVPTDPEFAAVYEVHDLVTAGQITWATAAEQVRKIRETGREK